MKKILRARNQILMLVCLEVFFLLFGVSGGLVIWQGYEHLDHKSVVENGSRAHRIFEEYTFALSTITKDWATWNEAYQYVQDKNPAFVTRNINATAVAETLGMYLVAFVDEKGEILIAKSYDTASGQLHDSSEAEMIFLRENFLASQATFPAVIPDVVRLDGKIILLSAMPLVGGDGHRPARGQVIFGKLLDDALLTSLSRQTQRTVTLVKDVAAVTGRQLAPVAELPGGLMDLTDDLAQVYLPLRSSSNPQAVGYLKVEIPREIHLYGLKSLKIFAVILLVVTALIMASIVIILNSSRIKRSFKDLLDAHQRLEISEKQYELLINALPKTVVLLFDREHRFLIAGGEELQRYDHDRDTARGRTLQQAFPPEIVNVAASAFDQAFDGKPSAYEHCFAGQCYYVQVMPVRSATGEIATGMMIAQNITEAKAAQQAVQESEARMKAIADGAHDGIIMMDPEGRISYWNSAAEQILGYTKDDALHQDVHRLLAPECYHESFQTGLTEFFSAGSGPAIGQTRELTAIKKDGEHIPIELSLSAVKIGGLWHAVGIMRDMTERHRIQQEKSNLQLQLFHSEKLATIGTIAAGVAHEINNPLMIVNGFIEKVAWQMKTQAGGEVPAKSIEIARHAVARITSIVGSLRTYARADTEHVETVDIHKSIDEMVVFVQQVAKNRGIVIHKNLASDTLYVRGNFGKIQQVLVNLLNNACDAVSERPWGREIHIETLADEKSVVLCLKDNGNGIPAANMHKIFEPFFTTKPVGKGTGLGLSISRTLIESFGGSLTVSSEEWVGATFRITLPRLLQPRNVNHARHEEGKGAVQPLQLHGEVLVVDDETHLCTLITEFLKDAGLVATAVDDARTALDLLQKKRFDLVITDMQMPGLSGMDLIRKAKTLELQSQTKFILTTGGITTNFSAEERASLYELIHGYLVKPFEQDQILNLIAEVLPDCRPSAGPSPVVYN
jgi:PAS domain S-box-containing protein